MVYTKQTAAWFGMRAGPVSGASPDDGLENYNPNEYNTTHIETRLTGDLKFYMWASAGQGNVYYSIVKYYI